MTTTQRPRHSSVGTVAALLDELERRPDLAIEADLTVSVDGHTVVVTGYDDLVALDLDSVTAALSLWRDLPADRMDAAAALASVGLTAELRVRGVPVARLGDDAEPSTLATAAGLGPLELVPDGALLALTRRRG